MRDSAHHDGFVEWTISNQPYPKTGDMDQKE